MKNPSEDFNEVEEWKSGIHPEVQARSKYDIGSKEHDFESSLQTAKLKIDQFNEAILSVSKDYDDSLEGMKNRIED